MKILLFFMTSVFEHQVHGGSTVILKSLVDALAENGDEVTVLCKYSSTNKTPFKLNAKTIVKPILRFKETFPDAYCTAPFHIAAAIEELAQEAKKSDLFINFDSNFLFQDIFDDDLPIISCLHDFVYSGALQGAFLFRRGILVANSQYIKDTVLGNIGRFYPELPQRLMLINNGIDTTQFKPVKPDKIFKYIPKNLSQYSLLLCPHRPEDGKGIFEALDVLKKLIFEYKHTNIKLLIARGLVETASLEVRQFYQAVEKYVAKNGLSEYVVLHDWIPHTLMNEYFSIGNLTLCLGTQIESFGITPLESILCNTPAIVSRVASYRYILPEWAVKKVDPGDTSEAARLADKLLREPENVQKSIHYIQKNYSLSEMSNAFIQLIHERSINKPLVFAPLTPYCFTIPTWCYISEKGIYNDYEKGYRHDPQLTALLTDKTYFTLDDAKKYGFTNNAIYNEVKNGYIMYKQ